MRNLLNSAKFALKERRLRKLLKTMGATDTQIDLCCEYMRRHETRKYVSRHTN